MAELILILAICFFILLITIKEIVNEVKKTFIVGVSYVFS